MCIRDSKGTEQIGIAGFETSPPVAVGTKCDGPRAQNLLDARCVFAGHRQNHVQQFVRAECLAHHGAKAYASGFFFRITNGNLIRQRHGCLLYTSLRSYGEFETYRQGFYSVALNQDSEALTDLQTVPAQGAGASAVWSRALGRRETLVAGFDDHEEIGHSNEEIFSSSTGINTKNTATGGHQRTTGIFGEDLIQIAPRWTLALSARFDDWSNFDAFLITQPIAPSSATVTTPYANRSYDAFSLSLIHI